MSSPEAARKNRPAPPWDLRLASAKTMLYCRVRGTHEVGRASRAFCTRLENAEKTMDSLTLFGLVAVTLMLVTYALEARSHWYILAFAGACALGSAYGFLQGAWPFGVVEAIWAMVALRRWMQANVA
jgi:hypothetical protein